MKATPPYSEEDNNKRSAGKVSYCFIKHKSPTIT